MALLVARWHAPGGVFWASFRGFPPWEKGEEGRWKQPRPHSLTSPHAVLVCPQSQGVPELSFLCAEMLCAFFAPKGHFFLRAVWAVSVNARPRDEAKATKPVVPVILKGANMLVEDTWAQGSEAKEEEEPLTLIANNAKVKQPSSQGRVHPKEKTRGF